MMKPTVDVWDKINISEFNLPPPSLNARNNKKKHLKLLILWYLTHYQFVTDFEKYKSS